MEKLAIIGGRPLFGDIPISGAKNSALKVMVAGLLTDAPLILNNMPNLADIRQLRQLIEQHGASIDIKDETMTIHAKDITSTTAPYDIVRKMRASFNVLGPLLAREGKAKVSLPGGCAIGARPVDLHLKALEAMGAKIELDEGYVFGDAGDGLVGADISFPFVSVGATEHSMMAASLAKGTTILRNAACEPEIVDLANCLNAMGAKVYDAGTSTITIEGVDKLHGATHDVLPDRIETGSYAMTVGMTGGEVVLTNTSMQIMGASIAPLRAAGLEVTEAENGIRVAFNGDRLNPVDVVTQPYPGFPTDMQAQFMAMMSVADGTSTITENIFENRFMHVPELNRLGAKIQNTSKVATIHGVEKLKGAEVMATDLRASMSLVLAALKAEGQSNVKRIYHLDRGFDKLDIKLRNVGALIERVADDS